METSLCVTFPGVMGTVGSTRLAAAAAVALVCLALQTMKPMPPTTNRRMMIHINPPDWPEAGGWGGLAPAGVAEGEPAGFCVPGGVSVCCIVESFQMPINGVK